MAESPTLRLQDSQTGVVYAWTKLGSEGWDATTHTLVDGGGCEIEVSDTQIWGDFARYLLIGSDLPVGMVVVRREDDGFETPLTLDRVEEEGGVEDEVRLPWRAVFRTPDGAAAILSEGDLLQGLQERPPIYRLT